MTAFKNTACLEFTEEEAYKVCLGDILCNQRKDGLHCDLQLVVDGQHVPVHKGVLVARCDYFAVMFGDSFVEEAAETVDMTHVFPSVEILETILDYLYIGRIMLSEDTIDEVMESAAHLLLESLGRHCAQYLLSNLSPSNCVHTWALADTYSMPELAIIAKNMTKSRFQDSILKQEESLYIPPKFLLKVTKEAMPQVFNVEAFLQFLLMWTQTKQTDEKLSILKEILAMYPVLSKYKDNIVEKATLSGECIAKKAFDINASTLIPIRPDSDNPLTEALVSYIIDGNADSSDIRLHVYAYTLSDFKWAYLGTIYTSMLFFNSQCELIGATGDSLIFKALNPHRLLSMTLANRENEEIHFPERHVDSVGLVTYKQFCYDQQVFCIVEDERRLPLGPNERRSSRALSELDFTTVRSLLVYDSTSKTWVFCCDIPLAEVKGGQRAALDYHIIDAGEQAYIWAMDMYWHEESRGGGPFWMKLVSEGGREELNYQIKLERSPPVSSQEWGYKQVKLMGTEQGILVYGYSHHCNMCMPMLLYNTQIQEWCMQEELVIHYPHVVLPLLGGTFRPETVHISQNTNVQCFSSGLLFHLEDLCPYISRFWALDIECIEWRELPAPPVTGLRNFIVCRMDGALLWPPLQDRSESDIKTLDEGPLLNCRLPDGASCFRSVTPVDSPEPESEDESYSTLETGFMGMIALDGRDCEGDNDEDIFEDALSDL